MEPEVEAALKETIDIIIPLGNQDGAIRSFVDLFYALA
jgi:hypothetical protein